MSKTPLDLSVNDSLLLWEKYLAARKIFNNLNNIPHLASMVEKTNFYESFKRTPLPVLYQFIEENS